MLISTISGIPKRKQKWLKYFIPKIKDKRPWKIKKSSYWHTVYVIVNLINKKVYFGKHSFNFKPIPGIESNYNGTNKHLFNSINKYGKHSFRMIILGCTKTEEESYKKEEKLITLEIILSKYCYNIQGGGVGYSSGEKHHIHDKIKLGIHPFQTRKDGTNVQTDKVKNGLHHFLRDGTGLSLAGKLAKVGKNPLQKKKDGTCIGGENSRLRVKSGTHHFLKKVDGTSISLTNNILRVKNGTHNFLNVLPWNKPTASEQSRLTWYLADTIYTLYLENSSCKYEKFTTKFNRVFGIGISQWAVQSMFIWFSKKNWIPNKDISWRLYRITNRLSTFRKAAVILGEQSKHSFFTQK